MPGNTIGRNFAVTTFGESHGPAIGCVVDGCPPALALAEGDIQPDLDRRRPGASRFTSQRREADRVRILSGVFEGRTTGAPIALVIENVDQRPRDYDAIKNLFRPGHADFTYHKKYGVRDHRGGGRASARETAARVAAGAIARKYLAGQFGVRIRGCLTQLGDIYASVADWDEVDNNPFFCADRAQVPAMEQLLDELRKSGDSAGARLHLCASGAPAGWGEPVFDRVDAAIAAAMMSINAVKGVEIGAGFASVAQRGSAHRDEITVDGFATNNAGGVLGGITTGQDILVSIAFKPTSSIRIKGRTVDTAGNPADISVTGRHDPCVGIRAIPIAEAMLALVLTDHALRHRAQCG